jgi:hypothetical protein
MSTYESDQELLHQVFDLPPPLGSLPDEQVAEALREMGDPDAADKFKMGAIAPWQHTQHNYGYVQADQQDGNGMCPVTHAGRIAPDLTLIDKRIKVTLDRLRVADYPGGGEHEILFKWYAENQLPGGQAEQVSFNQAFRAQEGESVGIIGYPIVRGLNVSHEGAAFKCYTVNVKNRRDETVMEVLESDTAKAGLKLLETAQPSLIPFVPIAIGITKMIASRNRNRAVQDFFMGLDFTDFSTVPTRARLRQGSYIVVQKDGHWTWQDYLYDPQSGHFVHRGNPESLIPYNYVVFGVSKYLESEDQ